ncbi:MAG: D-alanyl-D-alanine carboxypeptidase family protein [Candidatus Saccharibacteria bacterium]|nr:D-alanyl-D-alanine carboxypeptidase family protein [Candidatus Saccharibacteria bacterium]
MRVVEPKHFVKAPHKNKKSNKPVFMVIFALLFIGGGIAWYVLGKNNGQDSAVVSTISNSDVEGSTIDETDAIDEPVVVDNVKDTLRLFLDNEFKLFYDNLLQPNLQTVVNPPSITGNDLADARIRKIAEDRGYRLRSSPVLSLSSVEGARVQEPVVESWKKLKKAAADKGLSISIVSGYRSVEDQRALFTQRLAATGATVDSVANGDSDDLVNKVLITSSIPGYSKHHTGYTLDLLCSGYVFENFKNSPCQTWITADNYKVAKENGFIPSYPPLADVQGPDPEAWEYVWVGTDLLYE